MHMSMCRTSKGQNNGVLFEEVSAFLRCPLIESSLYSCCSNLMSLK